MDCQLGYPENEPGSVPHLPPIRRPVVPDTANVPTAKGVLNSNSPCGNGGGLDAPTVSADLHNNRHIFCTAEDARRPTAQSHCGRPRLEVSLNYLARCRHWQLGAQLELLGQLVLGDALREQKTADRLERDLRAGSRHQVAARPLSEPWVGDRCNGALRDTRHRSISSSI